VNSFRILAFLTLLLSLPSQAAAVLVSASPKTQVPAFSNDGSESRIGLLCHNDPVNRTDPFGLEFFPYTGLPISVDTIKAGAGLGESLPNAVVVPVSQGDGTFTLQLDVHITHIFVAERVKFHGKMIVRSDREKDVTFREHEKTEHGKDWQRFHDEKQKDVPTTRYDKNTADQAAKALTEKFKHEVFKANQEFNKHQPEERWRDIRNRELPH
jgi:hypothetical protein